jgi:hypothetical protein
MAPGRTRTSGLGREKMDTWRKICYFCTFLVYCLPREAHAYVQVDLALRCSPDPCHHDSKPAAGEEPGGGHAYKEASRVHKRHVYTTHTNTVYRDSISLADPHRLTGPRTPTSFIFFKRIPSDLCFSLDGLELPPVQANATQRVGQFHISRHGPLHPRNRLRACV